MTSSFSKPGPLDLVVRVGTVAFVNGVILSATLDVMPDRPHRAPVAQGPAAQMPVPQASPGPGTKM